MEEFHRIPIVIVDDEDELEEILKEGETVSDEEDKNRSRINANDLSDKMKEKGGKSFKERRFDEAIGFYLKALGVLELEQRLKEENWGDFELITREIILRSNCIACYVEKKDYEQAVSESRRLLTYIREEGGRFLKERGDLPTLWVNIENKTRYRLSLSLYSLFEDGNIQKEEGSKASVEESLESIDTVIKYYQKELKVSPPHEITKLYFKIKKALESQVLKTEPKESSEHKEVGSQSQDINIQEEQSNMGQKQTNYLNEYLVCFLEQDSESGSNSNSIPSPIQIVNRMNCNNSMEFLRIWQNICQNDQFVDYYLLFSQIFMKMDKIYSKTEMECSILEKILERISAIIDELSSNFPYKNKEKLISHFFKIIQNLEKTLRFNFVALMLTKNFQILDKIILLRECLNDNLLQKIKYFNEMQISNGIKI